MLGRYCLALKIVFLVFLAASLIQLGMGYVCADRTCDWRNVYPCVNEENGCPCKIGYYGERCAGYNMPRLKCVKRLGVAQNLLHVTDEQISASSWLNANFTPQHGRLYNPTSAWCGNPASDPFPKLQITFPKAVTFTGVYMQGDPTADHNRVTRVKISIQVTSGTGFNEKKNHGCNIYGNNRHLVMLPKTEIGVAIKIEVVDFQGDYPCLRTEVLGCVRDAKNPRADADCFERLGIADTKAYPDSSFSGSSFFQGSYKAKEARLDNDAAWCPSASDNDPYLEIQLPTVWKHIYGIVTQGYYSSSHLFVNYLRKVTKDGNTCGCDGNLDRV